MARLRAPSTTLVGLGRGRSYFNPIDPATGLLKGFFPFGNAKKLSVTTTPNTTQVKDYQQEASAPYAEFIDATDLGLAMEGYEQSEDAMALATLGDRTTLTQAAAPGATETLVAAALVDIKGRAFRTTKRNISNAVLEQGVNTLVLGTDYVIEDDKLGFIRLLETSPTIVDGTDIDITYDAAATPAGGLAVVRGASLGKYEGQLLYIPGNTNGPKREYHFHHVTLQPDGENSLISDDVNTFTLKGSVLSDAAGAYGGSVADPFYTIINRG